MTNPLTPVLDELVKQATMKFRPEDVARVQRVCGEVCRAHRIEVECPPHASRRSPMKHR